MFVLAEADAHCEDDGGDEEAEGSRSYEDVEERNAELEGAVGVLFIVARRTVVDPITPERGRYAGVELWTPTNKINPFNK